MIIFGTLLGLENLSREMQVGTYVIVVSTILLPIVGPGIQNGQNAQYLLSKPYAIIWAFVLLGCMISSSIYVFSLLPFTKISKQKMWVKFMVLLIARSTCFTLNLTASRVFILKPGIALIIMSIIIKIVSGAIYTWAIVVQSTEVVQSKFVPLNATCLMLLNAVTGIIIWEDWRVIESWTGYVCVFLLLALASYLLLSSTPLMTSENPQYGQKAHFRRQMRRSFASRTLNQLDLGSLSDSSEENDSSDESMHSCESSEISESDHEKDHHEKDHHEKDHHEKGHHEKDASDSESEKGEKSGEGGDAKEKKDVEHSGNTHPLEQDEEPPQPPPANDIEAQSPRPRLERSMTKREAWQSIYHIPHPKK